MGILPPTTIVFWAPRVFAMRKIRRSSAPLATGYVKEQRKGVARQAVLQLAQEGFLCHNVETIEILAAENNYASRAVALSCGAHFIDLRYGLIVLADGPVMAAIYHLRREDFIANKPGR